MERGQTHLLLMQGKSRDTNWNHGKISTNALAEIVTAGWMNINTVCNEIDVGFRQRKVAENVSLHNFVGLLLSVLKSKFQVLQNLVI